MDNKNQKRKVDEDNDKYKNFCICHKLWEEEEPKTSKNQELLDNNYINKSKMKDILQL